MTLEQKLERLDAIVAELENEQLDLSTALTLFEEGVKTLRAAASSLSKADVRVKKLVELADGAFVIEEVDDDA